MNLWNTKKLPMPPINTYKTTIKNIDIKHLYNVFMEGKTFFEDDNYLYAEYAVLSRIVYRMKQKFRSAKDFKAVEKIYKALDNYFKTGISSNFQNFMDLIPVRYKDETYLPTKNLLDYILVRLQGLAKLMERIVETCKISAYLLDKRIKTGHFWKIAFIIFSLVSRIYVLTKYTAKSICAIYNKLLPFSSQLRNTSHDWLPEKYVLPDDLKKWLNVKWLEVDDEVQIIDIHKEVPDIMQFFDLVDDDDVEFCNEYVMVDDDDEHDVEVVNDFMGIGNNSKDKYLEYLGELRGFYTREDVGEVIELKDSLPMATEDNSVQILDNTITEDTVNGSLQITDSSLQILTQPNEDDETSIITREEDVGEIIELSDSLPMVTEDNFVQILEDTLTDKTVNDSLQIGLEDSSLQIFTQPNEVDENSIIEVVDESDNEKNLGEDEKNESDILLISDVSGHDGNLSEEESVLTVYDTSAIETLLKVPKRKGRKNKKIIKNVDKMKDEQDETNRRAAINITEINKENVIVLCDTTDAVDEKVEKRKKKKRINQKSSELAIQSSKSGLSSKSNSNSFKTKCHKKKLKLANIGQINSSALNSMKIKSKPTDFKDRSSESLISTPNSKKRKSDYSPKLLKDTNKRKIGRDNIPSHNALVIHRKKESAHLSDTGTNSDTKIHNKQLKNGQSETKNNKPHTLQMKKMKQKGLKCPLEISTSCEQNVENLKRKRPNSRKRKSDCSAEFFNDTKKPKISRDNMPSYNTVISKKENAELPNTATNRDTKIHIKQLKNEQRQIKNNKPLKLQMKKMKQKGLKSPLDISTSCEQKVEKLKRKRPNSRKRKSDRSAEFFKDTKSPKISRDNMPSYNTLISKKGNAQLPNTATNRDIKIHIKQLKNEQRQTKNNKPHKLQMKKMKQKSLKYPLEISHIAKPKRKTPTKNKKKKAKHNTNF